MGAQETHAQTISKLIDAELGRYLAPAVLKDIRKQSLELSNKIRGLQRTNTKREKLKKDLSVFKWRSASWRGTGRSLRAFCVCFS